VTEPTPEANPFRPVLDALRAQSGRYFGVADARLEPFQVDVRRFSDVLRVRVHAGAVPSHVFIKIHKPESVDAEERGLLQARVAEEFSTAQRVRSHFAGHAGLSAVRAIACFPEHLAIVTEEVAGETLLQLLVRRAAWHPPTRTVDELCFVTRRVGRWLRTFQEIEAPGRRLSLADMREYIDVRLQTLVGSRRAAFSEADRRAILRYFDEQIGGIRDAQLDEVLIHADLALSNVLVDGTSVTVIDFGEPKYDVAGHDLTHLFTQIDLLAAKPQFSRAVVGRLQSALLDGFDAMLDPSEPLFRLLRLKHVLCHYATLATRPARPAERLYNWYVQRRHQDWLNALLRDAGGSRRRLMSNESSDPSAVWHG
jgi:tRNA A-37 threonylcarbamoyl transferase component Bud32